MNTVKSGVKQNKHNILDNKHSIKENQKTIEQNKSDITELKIKCSGKCIPRDVYEVNNKIVHGLIIALCITVVLFFISNVIWIYSWNHSELRRTTVINTDGTSNLVGNDGFVRDDNDNQ